MNKVYLMSDVYLINKLILNMNEIYLMNKLILKNIQIHKEIYDFFPAAKKTRQETIFYI